MLSRRRLIMSALAVGAALPGLSGCRSKEQEQPSDDPDVRHFGVAIDPWHLDEWSDAVGAKPTLVMEFEAFSRKRVLDGHFAEARGQGASAFMVTWEPWVSVSAELGKSAQQKLQPEYSNQVIAEGRWDEYVRSFARSVAASKLDVYIRYAHEMNGDWYPWSRDPEHYIAAWRRIVEIFRAEGASNAAFVYSVNPSVWITDQQFAEGVRMYWPGADYVDLLGSTMISFGGKKDYTVEEFAKRIAQTRTLLGKDVIITELNTAANGRIRWMTDLRTWLSATPWVRGVVLSQGASRGAAQLGNKVGNLSWNVATDPDTQPVVKAIIEDFARG